MSLRKFLPFVIFLVIAAGSLAAAVLSYRTADEAGRIKFQAVVDDAQGRISARIEMHLALLRATLSLFEARGGVLSRTELDRFVDGLRIDESYPGIRGIGYAMLVPADDVDAAEARLRSEIGTMVEVWPEETDQSLRTPIILLTPLDERNRAAIGYDMYSDPVRRAAMQAALETGTPQASGIVRLVQGMGEGEYTGFLIYLPLLKGPSGEQGREAAGFVYAPFRAGDLFNAALARVPLLPVSVEIHDGTDVGDNPFFVSAAPPSPDFGRDHTVLRQFEVAGRPWTAQFRPTSAFADPVSPMIAVLIGALGLLLGTALALLVSYQQKAVAASDALRQASEHGIAERDLMLQEMKHRIKNSITRVLAIARQTAANSEDIQAFSNSFSARMQAMAASQDMLTRSRWQKADLRELLSIELKQVFGTELDEAMLNGPAIQVDETTTQALGLTFHELATNALKYGSVLHADGELRVDWSVGERRGQRRLVIVWSERGAVVVAHSERKGFGTRLIDMNITRELDGTIDRHFGEDGLRVTIDIPF